MQRNLNIGFKSYTLNREGVYKIVRAVVVVVVVVATAVVDAVHTIVYSSLQIKRTEPKRSFLAFSLSLSRPFIKWFNIKSISDFFPSSLYYNIDWWYIIALVWWPVNLQLADNRIQYKCVYTDIFIYKDIVIFFIGIGLSRCSSFSSSHLVDMSEFYYIGF